MTLVTNKMTSAASEANAQGMNVKGISYESRSTDYKIPLITHVARALHKTLPRAERRVIGFGLNNVFSYRGKPPAQNLLQKHLKLEFAHPLGIAAGCDKDALMLKGLSRCGASYFEVGTVCPRPQKALQDGGVYHLAKDYGVINRLGFPSAGAEKVAARLARFKDKTKQQKSPAIGVNIGPNRESSDIIADIEECIAKLAQFADYLTINISSPNTKGLVEWHESVRFAKLIRAAKAQLASQKLPQLPLMVKLSPDAPSMQKTSVFQAAVDEGVKGLIISNTTQARPESLTSKHKNKAGGLSGAPLFDSSTAMLRRAYKQVGGEIMLIGCGGIMDGRDAWEKICAGASLLQVYTGFAYRGFDIFSQVNEYLNDKCNEYGLESIEQAIALEHKTEHKPEHKAEGQAKDNPKPAAEHFVEQEQAQQQSAPANGASKAEASKAEASKAEAR